MVADGEQAALTDAEHYLFGDVRSQVEYLKWANVVMEAKRCNSIGWYEICGFDSWHQALLLSVFTDNIGDADT